MLGADVDQVRASRPRLVDDGATGVAGADQLRPYLQPARARLQAGDLEGAARLVFLGIEVAVGQLVRLRDPEDVERLDGGIGIDHDCRSGHRLAVDAGAEDRHQGRFVGNLEEVERPLAAAHLLQLPRVDAEVAAVEDVADKADAQPGGAEQARLRVQDDDRDEGRPGPDRPEHRGQRNLAPPPSHVPGGPIRTVELGPAATQDDDRDVGDREREHRPEAVEVAEEVSVPGQHQRHGDRGEEEDREPWGVEARVQPGEDARELAVLGEGP